MRFCIVETLSGIGGSILTNLKRIDALTHGLGVIAELGRPRRVPMFHELFRGQRESTYILPYTFITSDGHTQEGRIWVCGCAHRVQYLHGLIHEGRCRLSGR